AGPAAGLDMGRRQQVEHLALDRIPAIACGAGEDARCATTVGGRLELVRRQPLVQAIGTAQPRYELEVQREAAWAGSPCCPSSSQSAASPRLAPLITLRPSIAQFIRGAEMSIP